MPLALDSSCDRLRQRRRRPLDRPNPDNVAAMARDAVTFIELLGFSKVDLLGYSLGGCVAQQMAAEHGQLVRKLILVGTAPQGGEEHLLAVLKEAFSHTEAPDPRLPLFFTQSTASQAAGQGVPESGLCPQERSGTDSGSAVTDPQAKALITWLRHARSERTILRAIAQPALRGQRQRRHYAASSQRLRYVQGSEQRSAGPLSRFRPRRPVSIPRVLSSATSRPS